MSYPPALPTHSYNHMVTMLKTRTLPHKQYEFNSSHSSTNLMVMKMVMLKLDEQMYWFVSRKLNNRTPYFKYLPHISQTVQ